MLEIGIFREEKERLIAGLKKKNVKEDQLLLINKILEADDARKSIQTQLDNLLSQSNKLADEIGTLFK